MDINADNLDVVTMLDVLEEEKGRLELECNFLRFPFYVENILEFTDQASAVLSGSDEKNCNGFVKRQALYACLTCAPAAAKNDFSKSIGESKLRSFKMASTNNICFRDLLGLFASLPREARAS